MSDIFFSDLNIPKPDYNLEIGSGSHGKQTGMILEKLEDILIEENPHLVIVYGDTNSTLAGALAAVKLHIPVAHVEAGLRSFDRMMPEEINRIITDHISNLLFCPTKNAEKLLAKEGINDGVFFVGDVMTDVLVHYQLLAKKNSRIIRHLGLVPREFFIATIHRPSNTDNEHALRTILYAFGKSGIPVIFPIHPRTRHFIEKYDLRIPSNVRIIEPIGYLDMIQLMTEAKKILTDSGGIQKEAYILGVPCITLRQNTEWVETLHDGWNELVGSNEDDILSAIKKPKPIEPQKELFPAGASEKIRKILHSGI